MNNPLPPIPDTPAIVTCFTELCWQLWPYLNFVRPDPSNASQMPPYALTDNVVTFLQQAVSELAGPVDQGVVITLWEAHSRSIWSTYSASRSAAHLVEVFLRIGVHYRLGNGLIVISI